MVSAEMRDAVALAGGAVVTHRLYKRWADVEQQQWVFYVSAAAFATFTAWLLLQRAPAQPRAAAVWTFGCWVALLQAAQVAVCGLVEFGNGAKCDLCIQALGRDGYTAIASGVIAAVLTWAWRSRHG